MSLARCHWCGTVSIWPRCRGSQSVTTDGGQRGWIDELKSITIPWIWATCCYHGPCKKATLSCSYKACTASSSDGSGLRLQHAGIDGPPSAGKATKPTMGFAKNLQGRQMRRQSAALLAASTRDGNNVESGDESGMENRWENRPTYNSEESRAPKTEHSAPVVPAIPENVT